MANHLRMYIPVRNNYFADQLQTIFKFTFSPPGNKAVYPTCAGRVRNNTKLPFNPVFMAPLTKFPDKAIGNLTGKFPPILFILIRKYFRKLGDSIVSQVDQASRVIYNQAYRWSVILINNFNGQGFSR